MKEKPTYHNDPTLISFAQHAFENMPEKKHTAHQKKENISGVFSSANTAATKEDILAVCKKHFPSCESTSNNTNKTNT